MFLLYLNLQLSYTPLLKRLGCEKLQNDHQRENALIVYQILSTYSLRKCIEISLENLYLDIGS